MLMRETLGAASPTLRASLVVSDRAVSPVLRAESRLVLFFSCGSTGIAFLMGGTAGCGVAC